MDLDGDGHLDLISGSWPGEIYFFRGGPDRTFAAPVKLKNKLGKTINIGGGRKDQGDMILIAGDAKFEKTDKGQCIIYDGERIDVPDGKRAGITGTASAVHAVDWNGDGVIDLLVGDVGGNVYLVPNEGTARAFAFGKEQPLQAGGKPLRVQGGDAGPFVCDWDGDGKLDLLVGAGDGSVWFYRNIGTAKEPKLAAGTRLVAAGETGFGKDVPKEPRRGTRAKVCAVDWDGDGKLDLLVGDFATQKPDRPEPTAAEKAEQDKLRADLDTVMKRYSELAQKMYGGPPPKDAAERTKLETDMKEVSERMQALRQKLPQDEEYHGWVWLFRRQPADAR